MPELALTVCELPSPQLMAKEKRLAWSTGDGEVAVSVNWRGW